MTTNALPSNVGATSTSGGTGDLSLDGAIDASYQTFSASTQISDGDTTVVAIFNQDTKSQWEVAEVTFNAGARTITRDSVIISSNSNAKVDFNAGDTLHIEVVSEGERLVVEDKAATITEKHQFNAGIDVRDDIEDDTTTIWDSSAAEIPAERLDQAGIDHGKLSNATVGSHHTRYTDSEASSAAPVQSVFGRTGSVVAQSGDYDHSELSGVGGADHHSKTSTFGALTDSIADGQVPASAVTQHQGSIDHDSLSGFVSNEHIDHSTVEVVAGSGITGGGDISSTRTLDAFESEIDHDALQNFVANEHLDWTQDQSPSDITIVNIPHDHSESGLAAVPNTGLENSALTVAGKQVSLGGSATIDLGDLGNVTATSEGSGGGFDADTVDGKHASEIGGGGGGGAMSLITTKTAADASAETLEFTDFIDDAQYDRYVIRATDIDAVEGPGTFDLYTSSDGGSNYSGGWERVVSVVKSDGNTATGTSKSFSVLRFIGYYGSAGEGGPSNAKIEMCGPSHTTAETPFFYESAYPNGSSFATLTWEDGVYRRNATDAINAFALVEGNRSGWAEGTVSLYGVKK